MNIKFYPNYIDELNYNEKNSDLIKSIKKVRIKIQSSSNYQLLNFRLI